MKGWTMTAGPTPQTSKLKIVKRGGCWFVARAYDGMSPRKYADWPSAANSAMRWLDVRRAAGPEPTFNFQVHGL